MLSWKKLPRAVIKKLSRYILFDYAMDVNVIHYKAIYEGVKSSYFKVLELQNAAWACNS